MATAMRGTGAGVVVLSCSDPRLNPYQILGLDPSLSKLRRETVLMPVTESQQRPPWFEMQVVERLMPSERSQSFKPLALRAQSW